MQPDRSVDWQTCTQDGSRELNSGPEEDRRGIICECPSQPAFGDRATQIRSTYRSRRCNVRSSADRHAHTPERV